MSDDQRRSLIAERGGISPQTIIGYLAPVACVTPALLDFSWITLQAPFLASSSTVSLSVARTQWGILVLVGGLLALIGTFLYHRELQLIGGVAVLLSVGLCGYLTQQTLVEVRERAAEVGYTGPIDITFEPVLFMVAIGSIAVIAVSLVPDEAQKTSFDEPAREADQL